MKPKLIMLLIIIVNIAAWAGIGLFLLAMTGCTTAEMTFPDGRHFMYHSNIFDKKFSEMTFYPDGSFCLVGYQSDAQSAIRLAELAIEKAK